MKGKTRRTILSALIVAAWAVPNLSSSAGQQLSCTAEGDYSVNPGLSTTPSSGDFHRTPRPSPARGSRAP